MYDDGGGAYVRRTKYDLRFTICIIARVARGFGVMIFGANKR